MNQELSQSQLQEGFLGSCWLQWKRWCPVSDRHSGMGSNEQDFEADDIRIFIMSSWDVGIKSENRDEHFLVLENADPPQSVVGFWKGDHEFWGFYWGCIVMMYYFSTVCVKENKSICKRHDICLRECFFFVFVCSFFTPTMLFQNNGIDLYCTDYKFKLRCIVWTK